MALPLPNLDDKTFLQIALEGRSLIPSTAPEWTDHNVHDPGITFLELFAWLAEIEHYRLNRTSAASYERFFSLIGLTRLGRQAAEASLETEFEALNRGALVPANTNITAIGNESVPFQTLRDTYLTAARLVEIVTRAGERMILQTKAEGNLAGHYEAFGPAPVVGDLLELGFEGWFVEAQGHLTITLFEDDLPLRPTFTSGAAGVEGFVPSAQVRWEYLTGSGWLELPVIEDGTLSFSRTGELIFRKPELPPLPGREAAGNRNLNWIRAVLVKGRFEIPPRIFSIVTNALRARQVKAIVNEDLGRGLGTPDQELRLHQTPLLFDPVVTDGPFQVGEVLDWRALVLRLARPHELRDPQQALAVQYVAERLTAIGGVIEDGEPPDADQQYHLAQAFDRLLESADFYRRDRLAVIPLTEQFSGLKAGVEGACQLTGDVRRFNRFLLQRIFPDLLVSDRVEIQTGTPVSRPEDEANSWVTWERVDDFLQSGPDDGHYSLDAQTGILRFGNGLNGRVPQPAEFIRARFYRVSQGEQGNLTAGKQWQLAVAIEVPPGTRTRLWRNPAPATGGRAPESLDQARSRAREVFRKGSPVLSARDYETAALQTPGLRVARAKAVANFNPHLPKLNLPGEMTVIVVPHPAPPMAFPKAQPPIPSDGFIKTVHRHLETSRLVTTNIHVVGPQYVPVAVSCRVFLKKGVAATEALASINSGLAAFLDPIDGGPERNAGWPFGRPVFPSEIHQQLSRIAAIDYVTGMALNEQPTGERLRLPYNGLPIPGVHRLELVSFEQRGSRRGGMSCE
jgi:Baseplate J-like protein